MKPCAVSSNNVMNYHVKNMTAAQNYKQIFKDLKSYIILIQEFILTDTSFLCGFAEQTGQVFQVLQKVGIFIISLPTLFQHFKLYLLVMWLYGSLKASVTVQEDWMSPVLLQALGVN